MPKFYVELTATAVVRGFVEVEADNEQEAFELAETEGASGNIEWRYDGVHDDTIQAISSS